MDKSIRLKTLGIGILVGPTVGFIMYSIFIQQDLDLIRSYDIAGMPLFIYAFIAGAPIGAVFAAVGFSLAMRLATTHPHLPSALWLLIGSVGGFLLASAIAILAWILGSNHAFAIVKAYGLTGAICGLLTGAVWTRRKRSAS